MAQRILLAARLIEDFLADFPDDQVSTGLLHFQSELTQIATRLAVDDVRSPEGFEFNEQLVEKILRMATSMENEETYAAAMQRRGDAGA